MALGLLGALGLFTRVGLFALRVAWRAPKTRLIRRSLIYTPGNDPFARRRRRGRDLEPEYYEIVARLNKGKGRFNRVETFRRLHFRIRAGSRLPRHEVRRVLRSFENETRRALHSQTNQYLLRKTPARTGRLKHSLKQAVEVELKRFNRANGFLEVRYNAPPGACYYARWVPRVRELLSSEALFRRMKKAFYEGAANTTPPRGPLS